MRHFIKFIVYVLLAFLLFFLASVPLRILLAQSKMDSLFKIGDDISVICIGNSHTGCTWLEDERYHNKVLWAPANPLFFSLLRLKELERRGCLGNGHVQTIVLDCDDASDNYFEGVLSLQFMIQLPFTWRYFNDYPGSKWFLIKKIICEANKSWILEPSVPPISGIPFSQRSREDQQRMINHPYNQGEVYIHDWESHFVSDMKRIKNLCDKYKLRLVFHASPMVKAWQRTRIDVCDELKKWKAEAEELGIEYYDNRKLFGDEFFLDPGHLTNEGAKKISAWFFETVLK